MQRRLHATTFGGIFNLNTSIFFSKIRERRINPLTANEGPTNMAADKAQDKFEEKNETEISQPSHTEKLLSESQSSAKQLFIKELEQRPRSSTVTQRESQKELEIPNLDSLKEKEAWSGTTKAVGEEGSKPKPWDDLIITERLGEGGGRPTNRFEEGGPSPRPTDLLGEGGGDPTNKFEEGGPSPRPTDMVGEGGGDPTNKFEEGGPSPRPTEMIGEGGWDPTNKFEEGGPIEKPPFDFPPITLKDAEGGPIEKPPTTMMDGEGGITTKCMDEGGPSVKFPRPEDTTLVDGEAGGSSKPPRIEDMTLVVGEGGGSSKPPRIEDMTLVDGEAGCSPRPIGPEDTTLLRGEGGAVEKPIRPEDTTLLRGEGGTVEKPIRPEDTTFLRGEGGSETKAPITQEDLDRIISTPLPEGPKDYIGTGYRRSEAERQAEQAIKDLLRRQLKNP
jgi:hypothetical protein